MATAQAQPNIALIKYWGKRDPRRNLPAVGSLSITLNDLSARTEVVVDSGLAADRLSINDTHDVGAEQRVRACLDRLRAAGEVTAGALDVRSRVNFPVAAGLASSAAGFAALVVAADAEYGTGLERLELARLAGSASGSAARSLYGGFVRLHPSCADGEDIHIEQLAGIEDWPLAVAIAITDSHRKALGSTEAMLRTAATSPYYPDWVRDQDRDLNEASAAVAERDFAKLADVTEANCLKMHAAMLAARPGIVYWKPATVALIHSIRDLRAQGVGVFFTIDAGPQVKAICLPEALADVTEALAGTTGVADVIETGLGRGAKVVV